MAFVGRTRLPGSGEGVPGDAHPLLVDVGSGVRFGRLRSGKASAGGRSTAVAGLQPPGTPSPDPGRLEIVAWPQDPATTARFLPPDHVEQLEGHEESLRP